jgi:hypothetical protein
MTSCVVFEVSTAVDEQIVAHELSKRWRHEYDSATVFKYPEYGDELFCYLCFYFGSLEEEVMVREAIAYLLDIASEPMIYYHRYCEGAPSRIDSIIEITIDDIFTEAFRPTIDVVYNEKCLICAEKKH